MRGLHFGTVRSGGSRMMNILGLLLPTQFNTLVRVVKKVFIANN